MLLAAGPVRRGLRTKLLVRRLSAGEIALIDHHDLDRVCAEELVAARAAGVLNCSASSGGSYPNLGPQLLLDAGVPLVDLEDRSLLALARDGEQLEVRAETAPVEASARVEVLRAGRVLARGQALAPALVRTQTARRRRETGPLLESFARNTLAHLAEDRSLLEEGLELPHLRTALAGRPALVVARGPGHRRDLRALVRFIAASCPALIAVDGAADTVLAEGLRPEVIVGDMDSASDRALRCGAELVAHAYPDGRCPAATRLRALGLPFAVAPAPGLSEDLALLLAAERGAEPIVSVGSQFNLVELLDRGRRGGASSFLTRLRVGERLIDARGAGLLGELSAGARATAEHPPDGVRAHR